MKDFIGYALKSNAGLKRFVLMMCGVMGGNLFFYLICLITLVADGSMDNIEIPFMEIVGGIFAGVCFAAVAEELIRMGVNCGVSRKNILKGLCAVSPVYAAAAAAMTEISFELTTLIFRIFGIKLLGCGYIAAAELCEEVSYGWRMRVLGGGLTLIFTLCAFSVAVMFVAGKMHSRKRGVFYALATSFVFWLFLVNIEGEDWLYQLIKEAAYGNNSQIICLTQLIAFTLAVYYLLYVVFAVIMRNTPVRGREMG